MQRFLNWMDENPTSLQVLGGIGSAVCGAGFQQYWGSRWMAAWFLAIAVFVLLPAMGSRRNRLQQGRMTSERAVRHVLETCAVGFGHPRQHIRTNIMLPCNGGKSRKVDRATAFNMDEDPDSDLELTVAAGVSGEAWVQRKPAYGDLTAALRPGGPSWGLTPPEKARVRSTLRSILSVPIPDPDNPDGALLGTLQIDSDHTLDETDFDDDDCHPIAERFADVVALLLKSAK
jgi:hypothetical protein